MAYDRPTAKADVAGKSRARDHAALMMTRPLALVAIGAVVLASCGSAKKASRPAPTSTAPEVSTTSTLPATAVVAEVLSPEKGSVQGIGGRGMVVVLTFTAKDPSVLPADFRLGGALPAPARAVKPGHNPAFPGLVVTLSTTSADLGGPSANLANLFQIVSPSKQSDGWSQVSAVWTNAEASFGSDVDVTLGAFTVEGTAPDTVPQSTADLKVSSNPAQVTFHLSPAESTTTTTTRGRVTTTRATTIARRPAATTPASATTVPAPATTVPATAPATIRPAAPTTAPARATTTAFTSTTAA